MIDYHIHTARCGHAGGDVRQYLEQAKKIGLKEIGFADHLPLFHTIDSTLAMSWDELPMYVAEINKLKEQFSGRDYPVIKLGIEADYIPGFADKTSEVLGEYDFDYVIGSIHFIDGWGFDDRRYIDNYDAYELADLYDRYYKLFVEAAKSGIFDVMAHPDLIKKYFRLEPEPLDLYERAARAMAESGMAVEVSSAGLRKPCREIYPGPRFLEICASYGIPISLGSDAHKPEQVGQDFEDLKDAVKAAGYKEQAVFADRDRKLVGIA